jgi:hypothetical protein
VKRNFRSVFIAVTAMGFILGTQTMAHAKTKSRARPQSETGPTTQQRLEELEQNQKVLERKWELEKEQA